MSRVFFHNRLLLVVQPPFLVVTSIGCPLSLCDGGCPQEVGAHLVGMTVEEPCVCDTRGRVEAPLEVRPPKTPSREGASSL